MFRTSRKSHSSAPLASAAQPVIEVLERRKLLSAALIDHTLTITGTSGDDNIVVSVNGANSTMIQVVVNKAIQNFNSATVSKIHIDGFRGNDTIIIDDANGPIVVGVTINGSAGNDTLIGGGESDHLFGGDGNDVLNGLGGRDFEYGEAGDDSVRGGGASDRLDGGDGN